MKINYKKTLAIGLSSIVLLPVIASAAGLIPDDSEINNGNGFCAFAKLINNIVNQFLTLSVSVAAITFTIAGAQILLNPENSGKREDAKEMFKKTVIGLIIILIAWLVVTKVIDTLVDPKVDALRFFNESICK